MLHVFPGMKVQVQGMEDFGYAEVCNEDFDIDTVKIAYYGGPTNIYYQNVPLISLKHPLIESQSRIFYQQEGQIRFGRIEVCAISEAICVN